MTMVFTIPGLVSFVDNVGTFADRPVLVDKLRDCSFGAIGDSDGFTRFAIAGCPSFFEDFLEKGGTRDEFDAVVARMVECNHPTYVQACAANTVIRFWTQDDKATDFEFSEKGVQQVSLHEADYCVIGSFSYAFRYLLMALHDAPFQVRAPICETFVQRWLADSRCESAYDVASVDVLFDGKVERMSMRYFAYFVLPVLTLYANAAIADRPSLKKLMHNMLDRRAWGLLSHTIARVQDIDFHEVHSALATVVPKRKYPDQTTLM